MNFEPIEIDETGMLEDENKFKTCFDVINQEEEKSSNFLNENASDNILLIRRLGEIYKISCYTRSNLKQLIRRRTQPPYILKNCRDVDGTFGMYVPINIGEIDCLFHLQTVRDLINSNYQIYYVEQTPTVVLCQREPINLYKVKVCGGANCLPQIFREEQEDEDEDEDESPYWSEREITDVEDDSEEEEVYDLSQPFQSLYHYAHIDNGLSRFKSYLRQIGDALNGRNIFRHILSQTAPNSDKPFIFELISEERKCKYIYAFLTTAKRLNILDEVLTSTHNSLTPMQYLITLSNSFDEENTFDMVDALLTPVIADENRQVITDTIPDYILHQNLIEFARNHNNEDIAVMLEQIFSFEF